MCSYAIIKSLLRIQHLLGIQNDRVFKKEAP